MVKIKNPDENLQNGNHTISIDPNPKASSNDIDAKRYILFVLGNVDYGELFILEYLFLERAQHHIAVYPTFLYRIQINWIPIPICMQPLAIKLAKNHKDAVVSKFLYAC